MPRKTDKVVGYYDGTTPSQNITMAAFRKVMNINLEATFRK